LVAEEEGSPVISVLLEWNSLRGTGLCVQRLDFVCGMCVSDRGRGGLNLVHRIGNDIPRPRTEGRMEVERAEPR
jgi:hypothetical protein